ncbi:hypothetical protein [Streptomyces buecherae]|uniref:Uncharacterized protein n=1 Tax=Streptomyces buecherae TaxID=2763006 RepID=A0A7H8NKU0_9ACTN|nr:hypothetical protein [Streptomyces buecherae]QKW55033.1 hypothetical protein HUT08_36495 [Streptomyces buecherae]
MPAWLPPARRRTPGGGGMKHSENESFEDDSQRMELSLDDHDPFYSSNLLDWVPICGEVSDGAVRFYWIMRALVIEKHGPVRKLTMRELCYLLPRKPVGPGETPEPSSVGRVRALLRELSKVRLISTPEGGPVTTSSRAKASARPLRIRIHDRPRPGYTGPPNAFELLDRVRPAAAQAAAEAVAKEEREKAEKRAAKQHTEAGQISDPQGAGQISDPLGQISNPSGQKSDPLSGADLQRRAFPLSPPAQSSRSDKDDVVNAVGQSAGGFASAGASAGAAEQSDAAASGCAASSKIPTQSKPKTKPTTIRTRERQMPAGGAEVLAAIPPEVCRPGTTPWVGLRRAVADLLTGGPGIAPRSPAQVIARMNRVWYGGRGPERSAPGYQPATTDEGDAPIRNRSSWLAAAILHQECPDPHCEDGAVLTTGETCRVCADRRAQAAVTAAATQPLLDAWREVEELTAAADARAYREMLEEAYAEHARREREDQEAAERRAAERAEDEQLHAQLAAEHPELAAYAGGREQ